MKKLFTAGAALALSLSAGAGAQTNTTTTNQGDANTVGTVGGVANTALQPGASWTARSAPSARPLTT